VDEPQYQELMDQLKRISHHLEEIKLENRERRRAEKEFWGELLDAIGSVEMAVGH
jgi:hypothetical protein